MNNRWLVIAAGLLLLPAVALVLHNAQRAEQAMAYSCGVIGGQQLAMMRWGEDDDCRSYRLNAVHHGLSAMANPDELPMALIDEGRHGRP